MRVLGFFAIAALVVSVAVQAAQQDECNAASPEKAAAAGDQAPQVGVPTETSGKVTSLHTVNLVGMAAPHVMAKILTEEGETDIVDLGMAADLKSGGIEPREGQQLWISGRVGRINDKFLVVAENISESNLVTITRTAPLREESEKHAAARGEGPGAASQTFSKENKTESTDAGMQVRTVEGTVIDVHNFKIEGRAEEHTLAKLRTEAGIVVVDLGATAMLPNVNLAAGQLVAASGLVGHLNSKPIIVAKSVGNLSSIQLPAEATPEATKSAVPAK